ncbi:MAG: carbohydrate kinase family protein [Candidatus Bathyarchaeota archaeon]|nr:carbohydrate kinase family protein [Candidatus Bathyarchaeota archaeon]
MTTLDAIGFGALNIDRLYKVNRIAGKDEESFVITSKESSGGSAANTIVGLTRLGVRTGFIGKIAEDPEGKRLLKDLESENVDPMGITIAKGGHSGIVMGFVDKSGERALYVAPGVNDTVSFEEIPIRYLDAAQLLHLTSYVAEEPFDSQKKLLQKLSENVKVSLDPGMLYAKRGLNYLRPLLRRTNIFLPNQAELKLLTGLEYEHGAQQLLAEGVQIVGVKLGKKGCFITNGREKHVLKPYETSVVDTTGAGDAWNAGFLYGILKKESLVECGKIANFVASRCITEMGARNGLPNHSDLSLLQK